MSKIFKKTLSKLSTRSMSLEDLTASTDLSVSEMQDHSDQLTEEVFAKDVVGMSLDAFNWAFNEHDDELHGHLTDEDVLTRTYDSGCEHYVRVILIEGTSQCFAQVFTKNPNAEKPEDQSDVFTVGYNWETMRNRIMKKRDATLGSFYRVINPATIARRDNKGQRMALGMKIFDGEHSGVITKLTPGDGHVLGTPLLTLTVEYTKEHMFKRTPTKFTKEWAYDVINNQWRNGETSRVLRFDSYRTQDIRWEMGQENNMFSRMFINTLRRKEDIVLSDSTRTFKISGRERQMIIDRFVAIRQATCEKYSKDSDRTKAMEVMGVPFETYVSA